MKKKFTAILLCIGMLSGMVTPLAAEEQYAIPVQQEDDYDVLLANDDYEESDLNDEVMIEDEPSVLSESLDSENDNLELPVPIVQKAVVPDGYIGIYTAEELDFYLHAILDGNFILMNDIDLSEYENWVPIGSGGKAFTGIFDGNGYKISNLKITATNNSANDCDGIGLFSYVYNATIQNLILENCKITVEYVFENVGTICGKTRKSTVDNCIASGSIKYVNNESQSIRRIGGILGCMLQSNIKNILSDVSLDINIPNATQIIGGNIGYMGGTANEDYTLENIHNVGEISCLSDDIDCNGNIICGGNIGSIYVSRAELIIKNLTNSGKITCNNINSPCVGGIIGDLNADTFANVKISNLQNTAIVTVNSDLFSTCSGVIGKYVMPSYSTGTTEQNDISYITFSQLQNNGKITNSAKIPNTGGLFGEIGYSATKDSNGNYSFVDVTISDSYNSGDIVVDIIKNDYGNNKYISGIIGLAESIHDDSDNIDSWHSHLELNNIYNIGDINVLYDENDNTVKIHNIICFYTNNSSENITSCYYPKSNISTDTVIQGCTALSDTEMQSASSFVGFDFDTVWEIGVTAGYPYPTLRDNPHTSNKTLWCPTLNVTPGSKSTQTHFEWYIISGLTDNATGFYLEVYDETNSLYPVTTTASDATMYVVTMPQSPGNYTATLYAIYEDGTRVKGNTVSYTVEGSTSSISTTFDTSSITLHEGDTFDFAGMVSTTAEDGLAAVQIDIHKANDDTVGITYIRKTNTDETSPLSGNSFDLSSIPSFKAGDTLTGKQSITLSPDTSWNIYLYAKDADGNTLGDSVVKRIDVVEKEVPFVAGNTYVQTTNTDKFTGFDAPYFAFNEDNTGKFHWVDIETEEFDDGVPVSTVSSGKDSFTYTITDDTITLKAGTYYIGNVADEIVLNIVDENCLEVAKIINTGATEEISIGCTSVGDQFEIGVEQIKPVVSGLKSSYSVTQGDTLNLNFTVTAGNSANLKTVTVRENGKTDNTYKKSDISANAHTVSCTIDTSTVGTHTFVVYAYADNYTVTDNVVATFTVTVKAKEVVGGERITKDSPCTYENVFKAICQILDEKNDGYNEYAKYDWEKNCSDKKGWYTDEFLLLCMTTAWTESNWNHYETDGSVKVHGASKDTGIMQLNTVDVITDDWLIESITSDWYYNLEYGMGNVWNAYLESKKTYTNETSIARGAYSRYNGGLSAGVTRWENNPIVVQDKNFYTYYQIMKEWFDGNDGGATGSIYKAYEVFCKFYGKIDIPVEPDEPLDEIQVVIYDSNGNVIKEGDTLNGKYTVVISNVPSAYQNSVNVELKDNSTGIIYQRLATQKSTNEYIVTFDTSMMYESSYSLAAFAWHVQGDGYKSSSYFNFDTENDAIYGFKLNGKWITDGETIRLTSEEATEIKIIPAVTNSYDYLGNYIVHPVEPMCTSSCAITQAFTTVYDAKKLSIYTHNINIESEGTYSVELSTSNGDRCNITLIVSDKAPAPEIEGNVFQQNDSRWGNIAYGYSDKDQTKKATIGSSGCGLLSLVNAIYKWKGIFINPESLADFSIKNGCRENGEGTIVTTLCKKYADTEDGKIINFASSSDTFTDLDDLATHFKENKGVALGHMSRGETGHWFAIVGYNDNTDEFLVYDSYADSFNGALGTTIEGDWCSRKKLTTNSEGNVGLNCYVLLYDGGAE